MYLKNNKVFHGFTYSFRAILLLTALISVFIPVIANGSDNDNKGIKIIVKNTKMNNDVFSYLNSYALLIGISDYEHDKEGEWGDLPEIPGELSRVKEALKHQGFQVEEVMNADSKELKTAFEDFIDKYGYEKHNRLLFFYSGHGHTQQDLNKGYIVPVDAPPPQKNFRRFKRKALEMDQILTWSRKIDANHAMFLFDSCFSGTIFQAKKSLSTPSYISANHENYVRSFVTAGSADEEVPAKSIFVPVFIRGLDGEADNNQDGYICDYELGPYIYQEVMNYNEHQTPQFERYGDRNDASSKKGSFVFVSNKHRPENNKKINEVLHITKYYNNCMLIDKSSDVEGTEKVKTWKDFVDNCSSNNLYSVEKSKMCEYATERLDFWKERIHEPTLRSKCLEDLEEFDVEDLPDIEHEYEPREIDHENIVIDHATGLMWQKSGSREPMKWKKAEKWVKKLNKSGYVGYSDWRLPSVEEAASLLVLDTDSKKGLLIDVGVFNGKQTRIWTGDKKNQNAIWHIDFKGYSFDGPVVAVGENIKGISVRAVRTME